MLFGMRKNNMQRLRAGVNIHKRIENEKILMHYEVLSA